MIFHFRTISSSIAALGFLLLSSQLLECQCVNPWEAEPVQNHTFWTWKYETSLNKTKSNIGSNKISIIFLGDSITDMWSYDNWGKTVWDKEYAPLGAVNFGIGGDRTQNALWRVQNGQLEKLTNPPPKLVVLCIGTNNIGFGNHTDDDIAKGVEEIVKSLGEKLPQTKVLLLGLFPRHYAWHFQRVANINLKIARLDKSNYGTNYSNETDVGGSGSNMVTFLDMWTHFAKSWGQVVPELFTPDILHLNSKGYAKWAQVMNSTFLEMLN